MTRARAFGLVVALWLVAGCGAVDRKATLDAAERGVAASVATTRSAEAAWKTAEVAAVRVIVAAAPSEAAARVVLARWDAASQAVVLAFSAAYRAEGAVLEAIAAARLQSWVLSGPLLLLALQKLDAARKDLEAAAAAAKAVK